MQGGHKRPQMVLVLVRRKRKHEQVPPRENGFLPWELCPGGAAFASRPGGMGQRLAQEPQTRWWQGAYRWQGGPHIRKKPRKDGCNMATLEQFPGIKVSWILSLSPTRVPWQHSWAGTVDSQLAWDSDFDSQVVALSRLLKIALLVSRQNPPPPPNSIKLLGGSAL